MQNQSFRILAAICRIPICRVAVTIVVLSLAPQPRAAELPGPVTVREDFATDPTLRGWNIFGDTNLFVWNSANQHLEVTWDSAKSNSYFRLPLQTLLTTGDDFSVTLNFQLDDIAAGVRPEFPGAIQIGFGFQYRHNADQPDFLRATGENSTNLVEFNYFPDTGFGATVWPVMILSNGVVNFAGENDFGLFELPLGVPMRIHMAYTATNRSIALTVTTNGALVGPVSGAPLVSTNAGFLLDAFAIASYSDAGQNPQFAGSILAHGIIDEIELTTPPPPIRTARGSRANGQWRHEILTLPGWSYLLEATGDLRAWSEATAPVTGTGDWITLETSVAPSEHLRFYRVKAIRN